MRDAKGSDYRKTGTRNIHVRLFCATAMHTVKPAAILIHAHVFRNLRLSLIVRKSVEEVNQGSFFISFLVFSWCKNFPRLSKVSVF